MKKKLIVLSAAAVLGAAAVPAMALENEFHGMYKFMGYETNFNNGVGSFLSSRSNSGWFAEQRARLQYIAKANDDLKLVTHFELDSRFGGKATPASGSTITTANAGYLGTATGNDAGQLDADSLTLETKSIYLDFNCPITGTNFKVGLQPWADSYQSLFLLADMTGVHAKKGFGPVTTSLGWFRFNDDTTNNTASKRPGDVSSDLIVLDGKFAINKDVNVGASYYNVTNDVAMTLNNVGIPTNEPRFERLHMVGLNADMTFGPANIKPFFAYQLGDMNRDSNTDLDAFMGGAVAKIKAGPGAINLSAIYLSGASENDTDLEAFQPLSASTTYFNPANMWLLIRNGQSINSSTSVLNNDLTVGGHGLIGVFAGYEGKSDKLFYNANLGYAEAAESWGGEEKSLGTEINAQVGYKLFDNLTVSVAGAYLILGDGLGGSATERLQNGYTATTVAAPNLTQFGATDADDPWMTNVQLSYVF